MSEERVAQKEKTVGFLLSERGLTSSALASRLGVSRTTALKVLNSLIEKGSAEKQGVEYVLSDGVAAVILRIGSKGGEIIGYSLRDRVIARQELEFSDMLSYNDNLLGLCGYADRYSDHLKKKYKRFFLCMIVDALTPFAVGLPSCFSLKATRNDLIAEALKREHGDAAVLYVGSYDNALLICSDGKAIAPAKTAVDDMAAGLGEILKLVCPQLVALDGELPEAEKICAVRGISLLKMSDGSGLHLDEREMLIKALSL